jgi:hypothetical protein
MICKSPVNTVISPKQSVVTYHMTLLWESGESFSTFIIFVSVIVRSTNHITVLPALSSKR